MSELKLAKNILELRHLNKYTQDDVCSQILIARQTYSNYERGERTPDLHTVCKLSELYHVSIDALLYVDLTENYLADSPAERHAALIPDNSLIRLNGPEARMLTNYKGLSPEDQKECREYILFKKKRSSVKDK